MKIKIALLMLILSAPLLMGQQGCESPLLPPPSLVEEIKEIQGAKISFSYDDNILVKITITHFHQGVRGKATVFLTNEQGDVLQTLYQNLFYDLFNSIPNKSVIKNGIAQKGDLIGIELKYKCLNPFGGCLQPDDFIGFYVLASGQEIISIQ